MANRDFNKIERTIKDFTLNVEAKGSGGGTTVIANPEGEATEDLTKLQVEDTIYGIPEGTEVVANPTMSGDEAELEGLQVGNIKYKVPEGGSTILEVELSDYYTSMYLTDELTNAQCESLKVGDYVSVYTMEGDYKMPVATYEVSLKDNSGMLLQAIYSGAINGSGNDVLSEVMYVVGQQETWEYLSDMSSQTSLGGGSDVVINERLSGAATDAQSIKVGDTNYNIPYNVVTVSYMSSSEPTFPCTQNIMSYGDLIVDGSQNPRNVVIRWQLSYVNPSRTIEFVPSNMSTKTFTSPVYEGSYYYTATIQGGATLNLIIDKVMLSGGGGSSSNEINVMSFANFSIVDNLLIGHFTWDKFKAYLIDKGYNLSYLQPNLSILPSTNTTNNIGLLNITANKIETSSDIDYMYMNTEGNHSVTFTSNATNLGELLDYLIANDNTTITSGRNGYTQESGYIYSSDFKYSILNVIYSKAVDDGTIEDAVSIINGGILVIDSMVELSNALIEVTAS